MRLYDLKKVARFGAIQYVSFSFLLFFFVQINLRRFFFCWKHDQCTIFATTFRSASRSRRKKNFRSLSVFGFFFPLQWIAIYMIVCDHFTWTLDIFTYIHSMCIVYASIKEKRNSIRGKYVCVKRIVAAAVFSLSLLFDCLTQRNALRRKKTLLFNIDISMRLKMGWRILAARIT